jgi:hypothetical protein
MPTLAQIQTAVDAQLTGLLAAIEARQNTYRAAHGGRTWQGLKTHTVHPSEGNGAPPTIGTASPADQPGEPWPAAVRNGNKLMTLACDCYRGPLGDGYQLVVWVDVAGVTWTRVLNVGPETWRNQGWAIEEP